MERGRPRILIVGGGIAGLALARALRLRGLDSEIVERSRGSPDAGTGVYLPANAFMALKALDLHQSVAARAFVVGRQVFLNHRGQMLFDVALDEVWGAGGPCLALRRGDLYEVLLEGAAGTPIHFGITVESLEGDGIVRVNLATDQLPNTTWSWEPTVFTPQSVGLLSMVLLHDMSARRAGVSSSTASPRSRPGR